MSDELAEIRAYVDVLTFEAAQRRGMTVEEYRAWANDPEHRRQMEEIAERNLAKQWPRSRFLAAGIDPPSEGV